MNHFGYVFLIYCNTNTDILFISQLNLSHCHVLICCRIKWLQLNSLIWTSDKTEKLKFAVIMTRFCFWCVWFTEHTSGPEPLGGNSRETMSDGELQRFGGGFSKSSLMILKTSPKPRRTLSQFNLWYLHFQTDSYWCVRKLFYCWLTSFLSSKGQQLWKYVFPLQAGLLYRFL